MLKEKTCFFNWIVLEKKRQMVCVCAYVCVCLLKGQSVETSGVGKLRPHKSCDIAHDHASVYSIYR